MKLLFLVVLSCLLVAACNNKEVQVYDDFIENTSHLQTKSQKPFYHGVASGDPLPESIILWTRVTPDTQLTKIDVSWEISNDQDFQDISALGNFETNAARDYTVKVEADGLIAGLQYFYRFTALEATSPIGKTITAPAEGEKEIKLAVASCSNYEFGYFNAYASIAEEDDLNAVVHLGDYIYEYGTGVYGDTTIGRINIPSHEIITLQDYRDRYSLYRLDPDLQAAHLNHPFITIWDDHEIANNSYKDGAQNHQEDEGDYYQRKAVARQAYYEWLPIREDQEHYRKFSFGEMVDLIMLDERLAGRTEPATNLADSTLKSEERTMLGKTQMDWFSDNLKSSQVRWKVIGNQVIFSYLNWGYASFNINLDSWDGYPGEQQKIADLIRSNDIKNVIFITGDTHSSWAFEVTNKPLSEYDPVSSEGAFAVEFGTTSINSGNSDERNSVETVLAHEDSITNSAVNPHLKYSNLRDHGYLLLTLTTDYARAEFKFVNTLRSRDKSSYVGKSMFVNSGEVKLQSSE